MTRRDFLGVATAATGVLSGAQAPLIVPVHRVTDTRARYKPEQLHHFWWSIWPEAVREFSRCGIQFQCTDGKGEIRFSAAERPILSGLQRGVVNLVLTDHIPMFWDNGKAWSGVTTVDEGCHVCVIALRYAHGNQVPYLSVNTCVHELLHVLLQDIFVKRPKWSQSNEREIRADWYATGLWLFHDGDAVRKSTAVYLERLRATTAP